MRAMDEVRFNAWSLARFLVRAWVYSLCLAGVAGALLLAPATADAGGIGPLKARIVSVLDELGVTTGGVYTGGTSSGALTDVESITGTAGDTLVISAASGRTLAFSGNTVTFASGAGADRWSISTGGHFTPATDVVYDFGVDGQSVRRLYANAVMLETQAVSTAATLGETSAGTVLVSSTDPYTITLPAAATAGAGRAYLFACDGTIVNGDRVLIDADGAELIDGGANLMLSTPYTQCELTCDGTGWRVTRWVPGQSSAYVPTGVTWTTNMTTTARMEQPAPRVVRCQVVVTASGVNTQGALSLDPHPPGFAYDEANEIGAALFSAPVIGTARFSDATGGDLLGVTRYIAATNLLRVDVQDEAAASTFYLVSVNSNTGVPVVIANGDAVFLDYTFRVQ
jgi:hypothetical protein